MPPFGSLTSASPRSTRSCGPHRAARKSRCQPPQTWWSANQPAPAKPSSSKPWARPPFEVGKHVAWFTLEALGVLVRRHRADDSVIKAITRILHTDLEKSFVHARFEACAATQPDAIAVEHGDRQISYSELDERANQLAHHLRGRGVSRGSVVMTRLERLIDLVVSLLATLKAGATYLPVEPDVSDQRMIAFVKETDCAAVITRPDGLYRFAELPVPALSADAGVTAGLPTGSPETSVEASNCAYIVYTSGSTGTPKGVRVDDASLGYLCGEINERYGINPSDRVLQFAAISFDTSIEQMFVTVLNGATLILPDHSWAPSELPGRLVTHSITVMDLTPPYWRAFLSERPAALRRRAFSPCTRRKARPPRPPRKP